MTNQTKKAMSPSRCVYDNAFRTDGLASLVHIRYDSIKSARHSLDTLAEWIAYLTGDEGKIALWVEESGI